MEHEEATGQQCSSKAGLLLSRCPSPQLSVITHQCSSKAGLLLSRCPPLQLISDRSAMHAFVCRHIAVNEGHGDVVEVSR